MKPEIQILWFKKDLRVIDHMPLVRACENKIPVFGIIYMPTKNKLYFTKDKKSYFSKLNKNGRINNIKKIKVKKRNKNIVILSRSHSLAKSEIKKAKKREKHFFSYYN